MSKKRTETEVSFNKLTTRYEVAQAAEDYLHITAIVDCLNRLTLLPHSGKDGNRFMFVQRDPDDVIAIAKLMIQAAEMAKKEKF